MDPKSVENKLQILTHQNQRLAVQLEEKRKASKVLEDKVAAYEQKEQDYEQTLLCVNRVWGKFTEGISHLCSRLAGQAELQPPAAPSFAAAVRDPFLQRLVSDSSQVKPLVDAQKRIDAELSDVEKTLVERARSCNDALASVLDAVRAIHAQHADLSAKLRSSSSSSADPSLQLLKDDNSKLSSELSSLRRELDALRAQHTSATEERRLAEDRRQEAEARIRQLQDELADTEQELSNIRKKYVTLKNAADASAGGAGGDAATVGGGGGAGAAGPSRQGSLMAPLGSFPGAAGGAGGAGGGDDGGEDLAEVQALLAKRTADLEKEKEAHLKTKRELQEAAARVGDEAWVPATRMFCLAQQQVAALGEALAARAREVEVLGRERDEALREAATKASLAASEAHMRSKLAALERSFRELQFAKADADRARAEAEAALGRERARAGHTKTVAELQALVGSLQAQVANQAKRAQLDKAAQDRWDAGAREVVEAATRLAARELEAARLRDALSRRDSEADAARRQEAALKDAVADLKSFVEVLTSYYVESRDVVALRASEVALRSQVADLRHQLQGHALHATIRELSAAEKEARGQLEAAAVEADNLRLQISSTQRAAQEVAAQLAHSRSECTLYTEEIEALSAAFDDLQAQNGRLLASLAEKDEATNAVVAERLKLSQQVPVLTEAAEAARSESERLSREVAELGAVREAMERDMGRLAVELAQVKEQLRSQAARLEAGSLEVRRRDDSLAALQQQLEATSRQVELKRQALEEADQKLVKEKSKRQRVEEENKALSSKVDKLKKLQSPAGAARELQEEVDAMRRLLNCNVCHERQKNRIITKCCHVFCDVCIDRTLTARNRKCPGCGVVFAKGDVKTIFFT